ncbi:TRAP transporter substrate-binding protein [Amorphus coralli]|uniref:TRAP transporter substrate-binding protein n=1 Tax=Amorphus coralli TaxID=340680 RepID=UPI00037E8022|nr:TRAP transporter substrate-binding protein [Amorphus coralli]
MTDPASKLTRRAIIGAAAAAGATGALARPAIAQGTQTLRMVTSWPKNLPGPGVSAERVAAAIGQLSGGRLQVKVFAAGELVPALETFDAVQNGTADMAHTAAIYWTGKMPSAPLFTTAPFGLTPREHMTWIDAAGGQALWDELYADFGVKPFMAGNTEFNMAGWYNRPLETKEDLVGLKVRIVGLGADILRELGATPVGMPTSEVFGALQSGVVDGAELLGPYSDTSLGMPKVAKFYYGPGFNKPNGTGEAIINRGVYDALPVDLQAAVAAACAQEHARALSEAGWRNAESLKALREGGTEVRLVPADILAAAEPIANGLYDTIAARDPLSAKIVESYRQARATMGDWGTYSIQSFLRARLS